MFPPPSDQIGPTPPRTKLEHFKRADRNQDSWHNFHFKQVVYMDQQVRPFKTFRIFYVCLGALKLLPAYWPGQDSPLQILLIS